MEIEVLHNFIKNDPKLLTDYIQSIGSGEVSFFPTTLSLVYDWLVGRMFPKNSSNSDSKYSTGGQNFTTPNPFQAWSSTSGFAASPTPGASSSTAPAVTTPSNWGGASSSSTPTKQKWLKCARCRGQRQLGQLFDGLHCPQCPATGRNGMGVKGRPFMVCSGCNQLRTTRTDTCIRGKCRAGFF